MKRTRYKKWVRQALKLGRRAGITSEIYMRPADLPIFVKALRVSLRKPQQYTLEGVCDIWGAT